jgi:hypothetical protein
MTEPMVLDGPINCPALLAYVEQVLILSPQIRDIETMQAGQAGVHRVVGRLTLRARGGGRLGILKYPTGDIFDQIEGRANHVFVVGIKDRTRRRQTGAIHG